jgi:hypothetical protein
MGFDAWWDGFRKWQGGWRFPAKDEPEHKITAYAAWQAAQSPITPTERLAWTREKPTEEGWYWSRWKNGCYDVLYLGWYTIGDHGEKELAIDVGHGYDRIEMQEGDAWLGPLIAPPFPEPIESPNKTQGDK